MTATDGPALTAKRLHAMLCVAMAFAVSAPSAADGRPVFAAEAWPSKISTTEAGELEYRYDLREIKRRPAPASLRAELGEQTVELFLKALPNEATVVLDPRRASLRIASDREMEPAPLVGSFTQVPTSPRRRHALLPSVDLFYWKASQFDDGFVATFELAAESGSLGLSLTRRELWKKILDAAIARYRRSSGDAKDGALLLAARIGASNCLDESANPGRAKKLPELEKAVSDEIARLRALAPGWASAPAYRWNGALRCIFVRERVLAEQLPSTRPGVAAALLLIEILDQNPAWGSTYAGLADLRDALFGRPEDDPLARFRGMAQSSRPGRDVEDLGAFIASLASQNPSWEREPGPPLFASAQNPVRRFLFSLQGVEREHSIEELGFAIQEGRVSVAPAAGDPWSSWRYGALLPLLRPQENAGGSAQVSVDQAYRSRLFGIFEALHGWHSAANLPPPSLDPTESSEPATYVLKVRLALPPQLEVEPLPDAYQKLARAYARLGEILAANKKVGALQRALPSGARRPVSLQSETRGLERLFRGLSVIARRDATPRTDGASEDDSYAVSTARRFLASWRADPDLSSDARFVDASVVQQNHVVIYSGVFGIGRQQLEVSFGSPPSTELIDADGTDPSDSFQIDSNAIQRYAIPVIATGAVTASAQLVFEPNRFRAMCNQTRGDPAAIEAALMKALASGKK